MQTLTYALIFGFLAHGVESSYPTACNAYSTCQGLAGDCCPTTSGVNLACCFTGALEMDANKAEKAAEAAEAAADKEAASAEAASAAAQAEAAKAKAQKDAADKRAAKIDKEIIDLKEHATAAQKKAQQAATQATNDATAADNKAKKAEAAAAHAKAVEQEQKKIVAQTEADAAEAQKAAKEAEAKAKTLNDIAGAAAKKLNDEKAQAEKEAAAAKLKEEEENKVVAQKDAEAKKIRASAEKQKHDADEKKAAAEAMLKKMNDAKCSNNAQCKGLAGYCCPTMDLNKMTLGSGALSGVRLGCCGAATPLAEKEELAEQVPELAGGFGVAALFLAAAAGSAVTATAFKLRARKEETNTPYERLVVS